MPESAATSAKTRKLRITEIFYSLQGETRSMGVPTVFIRLTGCPLRCGYCDTSYAFTGGQWMTFDDILTQVRQHNTKYVTVTGGEPLAQKECAGLLTLLCEQGYSVSLETSGAINLCDIDQRVSRVMDLKTPGSGECAKNLYENIECLTPHDQVKFVICDRADYDWAVGKLNEYNLARRCEVLFSPAFAQLPLADLAGWVLSDELPVRVQIQLHKLIWGDEPGR